MEKYKTKAIQTELGIFMHIPAYSGIFRHIQAYSGIFKNYLGVFLTLCNPVIFRTLVYSEFWHIQNQRHIQNPCISKTLANSEPDAYSESWAKQNPEIFRTVRILKTLTTYTMERFEKQLTAVIILASYNYFRNISFLCPLVHEANMNFLMHVQVSLQKSLFNVKKYGDRGAGDRKF